MVRTRNQNPGGIQSPLESISTARGARNRPGPPSDASAVLRSPSVASDGVVYIGEDEGDDESQISEPAVDITLSDDEEEKERVVITVSDDDEEEEDDNSIIEISSDEESEDEDDISELDLGGETEENEDEDQEEIPEPQVHRFYGKIRIKQSVLDRHAEEDANRPPFSPNLSLSSGRTPSPDRTISAPPSPRNPSHDCTISAPHSPHNSDPGRTISVPPPLPNIPDDDRTINDPDRTISVPPSPVRPLADENQDEEMIDDGIVDYQPPPYVPYNNRAPSHFTRVYRGVTTIWSFDDWADEEEEVLAAEAAERERERLRRRRWASNGGRSRLARQRAFRRRHQGAEPRARVNGRFA
ncbi:hypothetical protein DL95DRAFT_510839 [Leptodontidium sp. 2 PMI_412]|nr:hypothetical protein DL95DRAFT_510839 [Leptodontidium sp. 2 PMI_412]